VAEATRVTVALAGLETEVEVGPAFRGRVEIVG
jgi:hypothetical protein